jgi:hypothetical protein
MPLVRQIAKLLVIPVSSVASGAAAMGAAVLVREVFLLAQALMQGLAIKPDDRVTEFIGIRIVSNMCRNYSNKQVLTAF